YYNISQGGLIAETKVKTNNHYLFSFSDYFVKKDLYRRSIDNFDMYLNSSGTHLYSESNVTFDKIKPIKLNPLKYKESFLTLDIETYLDSNNNHVPFILGYYDGKNSNVFYLSDYSSPQELIIDCFKSLLVPKNRNKVVYVHNLSRFDGIFLINSLLSSFNIKPVIRDNQIYSINIRTIPNTIKLNVKKIPNVTIHLHDSFLMLPSTLRNLSHEFNVRSKKGYFPYKFVNADNLNYVGKIPPLEFFSNIPPKEYNSLSRDQWNLKDEGISYLISDLTVLHEVMSVFSKNIFADYILDIKDYLTLPSLAFAIFRSSFFDKAKNKLPIIKYSRFAFLEEGYYGGSVDLYKPSGNQVYCYDAVSLYPFSMLNDMPVGDAIYSNDPNLSNWFGFLRVKVKCPDNLLNPILPFRKEDGTVIHPVGSWTGVYFSEELKNAEKLGYKFEILEGLKFERGSDIFKDYFEHFFKLKSENSEIKRKIGKLMLNSLYGRFGMKNIDTVIDIVSHEEALYILSKHEVYEHIHGLQNGFEIIKYSKVLKNNKIYLTDDLFKLKKDYNIHTINSLGVAISIAAYGRIYLSQFKNLPDYELLYSDTDSLFLSKPLPLEYI
ncbi:MAG: DNA polymerase, partial [bacterium]